MNAKLSVEEILRLPAVIDMETASEALGIGRTRCYALARSGNAPFEVLMVGRSYRVRSRSLLRALGLDDDPRTAA